VPASDLKEMRCELTLFSGKLVFQGDITSLGEVCDRARKMTEGTVLSNVEGFHKLPGCHKERRPTVTVSVGLETLTERGIQPRLATGASDSHLFIGSDKTRYEFGK
jgi:hypothetical protein